jgi:SpoVK/Ycf46/Vps4 family AAA+-type ATPase
MPDGIVLEKPPFVPRMVMTNELQSVTRNVIEQWKKREAFAGLLQYGIRPLDRLLFYGPPGNGKTMACYWIARELRVPIYRVLCNSLVDSYVGSTCKNVANVVGFLEARREPAICLWDEVEAIFMDRKNCNTSAGREITSALTIFMQALDRWRSPTLIVMATNLPEQLDHALLSRVELRVEFLGPDEKQCKQVVQYWSELLHDHGGSEWGPKITDRLRGKPAGSFRELQQEIAYAARDWTARNIK